MSFLIWETVYYMIETLHSDFVLAFLGGICQGQAYSVCGQKEERVFSDIEHRWTWTMIMLKDLTRILGNLLNGNIFTIKDSFKSKPEKEIIFYRVLFFSSTWSWWLLVLDCGWHEKEIATLPKCQNFLTSLTCWWIFSFCPFDKNAQPIWGGIKEKIM